MRRKREKSSHIYNMGIKMWLMMADPHTSIKGFQISKNMSMHNCFLYAICSNINKVIRGSIHWFTEVLAIIKIRSCNTWCTGRGGNKLRNLWNTKKRRENKCLYMSLPLLWAWGSCQMDLLPLLNWPWIYRISVNIELHFSSNIAVI